MNKQSMGLQLVVDVAATHPRPYLGYAYIGIGILLGIVYDYWDYIRNCVLLMKLQTACVMYYWGYSRNITL